MTLLRKEIQRFIIESLKEDIGDGDFTSISCVPNDTQSKANLYVKEKGIIAGIKLAKMIFFEVDKSLKFTKIKSDGEYVTNNDIAFSIEGNAISILKAERLVLNCMQQMSAIATKTNHLNSLINHTKAKLLDTRKTIPLNRVIQKEAVKIGGGENHRFQLSDMIMIKDNHVDCAGGISNALEQTKKFLKEKKIQLEIIVEARNINEVKEIMITEGAQRILLDNFDYKTTKQAVMMIGNKYQTESSGCITEENISRYAECGVDFISVGALTHSIKNFDLSLKTKIINGSN